MMPLQQQQPPPPLPLLLLLLLPRCCHKPMPDLSDEGPPLLTC
jgi:hypothetical protein